jgi:hypothetical protein
MASAKASREVEIRNQKGDLLATLKPGDRSLKLETLTSTVDLRPLERLGGFEHIELVGAGIAINAPHAILPERLPGLRTLIVRGRVENPAVIANYTELQTLNPGISCWLDNLDFVRQMPRLERLEIALQNIDDLTPLQTLEHLRVLDISHSWRCDLAPLGTLTQLEELRISGYRKGLQRIRSLVKLHTFALYDGHSTHLNMLKEMRRLRVLSVLGGVSDVSVLRQLPQLKELSLRRTRVDDEAITALIAVPGLTKLSLRHADRITDVGPIGTLRHLRDLDLTGIKGPLRTLRPLASLTQLEVLYVGDTEVADRDASPIFELTKLKDLWVGVHSDREEAEFRRRFPDARLAFYRWASPDQYLELGDVRVWKPTPALPHFWISQDLTSALKVAEQAEAEKRIARAFKAKHPTLAGAVEYDSEGSAFVANAKSEGAIRALADVINELINGPHPDPPPQAGEGKAAEF